MLIAIIHSKDDPLAVTLTALQPQLSIDDDIYIVDTTDNRQGLEIAKKYCSSKITTYVELVADKDTEKIVRIFGDKARENGHKSILFLGNVLFSSTFISNLKKGLEIKNVSILTPEILPSFDKLNPNFTWHNPPTKEVVPCNDYTSRCYLMTFKGSGAGKIPNEKIVLL